MMQGSRARHCCRCVYSLLVSFVVLTYPLMTGMVPRMTQPGRVPPVPRASVSWGQGLNGSGVDPGIIRADNPAPQQTSGDLPSLIANDVPSLRGHRNILSANLSIPRLIHQTWETEQIPAQFQKWVSSWPRVHPSWEHWFWTESASRLMIRRNFSHLLADTYVDYPYAINRADARRYFILYRYGGVYADLDVQSLRSLDPLLKRYPCLLAQEPSEHQALLYGNKQTQYVMPALMACRPHHPFFKLVLQSLPGAASLATSLPWNDNVFYSTGPMFLTEVYHQYRRTPHALQDQVYLAPPNWFMPTYDTLNEPGFRACCANQSDLSRQQQTVCADLRHRDFRSGDASTAMTWHHWVHSWGPSFVPNGYVSAKEVVPSVNVIDAQ